MPALINCHVHLGWDGVHSLRAQSEWPEKIQAFTVAMNIARNLHAGVTTVRDLGMCMTNIHAKVAIEDGRAPWLRLFTNGRAISTTGGHTWFVCRQADGIDDCRRAIREQVVAGATWIKIMACHDHDQFTQAELDAMVDEAHQAGLKVTAHATMDSAIKRVVRAGVDCIEHGGPMSDEAVQLLLDRKVWLVTTLGPMFLQAEHGLEHGLTQEVVDRRNRQINEPGRWTDIKRAVEAGVHHAFGTDAGSPLVPHDEVVGELKALLRLGICKDIPQALRTATTGAARLMGVDADLGTIEPGRMADLLVLGGNPVEDLEHLRTIQRVYVKGSLAVQDGLHGWPIAGAQVPLKLPGVVA
jgi:imidazolonepropionase-like amidohydrolase